MTYIPIPQNPYIVGNPIQSDNMFYGRNEDFLYIKDKLHKEARGLIITLAGERRSGKTSILFQILNGRLGDEYLPFFVDMQAMAAVDSDAQFLSRLDKVIRGQLTVQVAEQDYYKNKWSAFENFLGSIKEVYPNKKIMFLLDEYELIESKIDKKLITDEMITFFANLMENHNIFFLFTGSNKLEDHNAAYWKILFSKSQYRKITFLRKQDCLDLITKPVTGFVFYTPEQLEKIWRLTAGQPFYTQIFCQNMVDRLQLEQHNEVLDEDIDAVITDIVDNPMPQMIYFWQELDAKHKLTLSLLAERINSSEDWVDYDDPVKYLRTQKMGLKLHNADIHTSLEELYHNDILTKKGKRYQFRIDIFRFWIKQEQNVWKLLSEIEIEKETYHVHKAYLVLGVALLLGIIYMGQLYFRHKPQPEFGVSNNKLATNLYQQAQDYYADNNNSFALQTINRALAADSSFFLANMLKAEILQSRQELPAALTAYQHAEKQYNYITHNIGKQISRYPQNVVCNDKLAHWRMVDDYFIYDIKDNTYYNSSSTGITSQAQKHPLYIYHLKKSKWVILPNSVCVQTDKNAFYYLDFDSSSLCKYDINRSRIVWKTRVSGINMNSLLPKAIDTGRCKYLIMNDMNQIYIYNLKTGKPIIQKLFADDIREIIYLPKDKKLWVIFTQDNQILDVPGLALVTKNAISDDDLTYSYVAQSVVRCNDVDYNKSVFYEFDKKAKRIIPILTFGYNQGSNISNGDVLSKKLVYMFHNNKPQVFNLKTRKFTLLPNLGKYHISRTISIYFDKNKPQKIFFTAGKDLLVYNMRKHKIRHVIPLSKLSDNGSPTVPSKVDFDKYRKRIFCLYSNKSGTNLAQGKAISIYDLKSKNILYSNNFNFVGQWITYNADMYIIYTHNDYFDGMNNWFVTNMTLMNPKNFQTTIVDNIDNFQMDKKSWVIQKDRNFISVKSYPLKENVYLQKLHEAIILLGSQFNRKQLVLDYFDKLIGYSKKENDINVLKTVIKAAQVIKPDLLGYYADKCIGLSDDLKSITPDIIAALQLKPSERFKDKFIPLTDYEDLKKINDELVVADSDYDVNQSSIYRISDKRKQLLYKTTNISSIIAAEGISTYTKENEPSRINLVDKQNRVYTYPLPFPGTMRTALNWYDDNSIVFVTQTQKGNDFTYQLQHLDKLTGQTQLWQKWDSNLHLQSLIQKPNKVGFSFSDSLARVFHISSPDHPCSMPDFAQIVSVDSKNVVNADQVRRQLTPESLLTYTYQGNSYTINLTPDDAACTQFFDLAKRYIQWYDVPSARMEPLIELALPCFISNSYIDVYSTDDIYHDHLVDYQYDEANKADIILILNINTSKISQLTVMPSSSFEKNSHTFKDYFYKSSSSEQGFTDLKMYKLSTEGKLDYLWEIKLPYDYITFEDYVSGEFILSCYRILNGTLSCYYIDYVSPLDGKVIKSIPMIEGTSVFTFSNQPPVLFHKKLGFFDLTLPGESNINKIAVHQSNVQASRH